MDFFGFPCPAAAGNGVEMMGGLWECAQGRGILSLFPPQAAPRCVLQGEKKSQKNLQGFFFLMGFFLGFLIGLGIFGMILVGLGIFGSFFG